MEKIIQISTTCDQGEPGYNSDVYLFALTEDGKIYCSVNNLPWEPYKPGIKA